jgi:hypothetical protein
MEMFDAELFIIRKTVYQLREFLATYHKKGNCPIRKVFIFFGQLIRTEAHTQSHYTPRAIIDSEANQ